jgi:Pentapeptide repeats (8 copies)
VSPNSTRVTRQQRRDLKRRGIKPQDFSRTGRWERIGATGVAIICLAWTAVARFNDARAFEAIATPGLYGWLGLSLLCTIGVALTVRARRENFHVPSYFRWTLRAGVACGLLAVVLVAWPVLFKDAAQPVTPLPGERLDIRNQTIHDRSFAGRNLRSSNLSGATLRHVDLGGVDLSESDLRNVRFEDVNLSGAELCGVDLRGADLRGARGLGSVYDWSYVFYNTWRTRLPDSQFFLLDAVPGPIPDTGRDLLYMCGGDVTKRIESGS